MRDTYRSTRPWRVLRACPQGRRGILPRCGDVPLSPRFHGHPRQVAARGGASLRHRGGGAPQPERVSRAPLWTWSLRPIRTSRTEQTRWDSSRCTVRRPILRHRPLGSPPSLLPSFGRSTFFPFCSDEVWVRQSSFVRLPRWPSSSPQQYRGMGCDTKRAICCFLEQGVRKGYCHSLEPLESLRAGVVESGCS